MLKPLLKTGGIACLALLCVNMGITRAKTKTFTSEAGRFSIKFKGNPVLTEQDVPTDLGDMKMYLFLYEEGDSKAYMAAYNDYPLQAMDAAQPLDVLQASKGGVLEKIGASITTEKVSKFKGYDCIDFTADGPEYHAAYKMVLAKNRLYQVGILQTGTPVNASDNKQFIGSFKIKK